MTEIVKKTRPMTDKRFATYKLSGRATAEGFLAAHMAFLREHAFLDPILDAYDREEILPTPTLQAVQSALMTHLLESIRLTEEDKMRQRQEKRSKGKGKRNPDSESFSGDGETGHTKRYTVTLFVTITDPERFSGAEVGTIHKIVGYRVRTLDDEVKDVSTKEETEGLHIIEIKRETKPAKWEVDSFGKAMNLADRRLLQREDSAYCEITNNDDPPLTTKVERTDAIARMLKNKKGAVSRTRGRSTRTLGFQPHAKSTKVTGPWSHR